MARNMLLLFKLQPSYIIVTRTIVQLDLLYECAIS